MRTLLNGGFRGLSPSVYTVSSLMCHPVQGVYHQQAPAQNSQRRCLEACLACDESLTHAPMLGASYMPPLHRSMHVRPHSACLHMHCLCPASNRPCTAVHADTAVLPIIAAFLNMYIWLCHSVLALQDSSCRCNACVCSTAKLTFSCVLHRAAAFSVRCAAGRTSGRYCNVRSLQQYSAQYPVQRCLCFGSESPEQSGTAVATPS